MTVLAVRVNGPRWFGILVGVARAGDLPIDLVMLMLVMTDMLLRHRLLVTAIGSSGGLRELQRQHGQQKEKDPATHGEQYRN